LFCDILFNFAGEGH